MVAAVLDEAAGLGEVLQGALAVLSRVEQAGAGEVDVGHEQAHGAARGDLPGLVQVGPCAVGVALQMAQPGAGEEATGQDVLVARAAEAVHGGVELLMGGLEGLGAF